MATEVESRPEAEIAGSETSGTKIILTACQRGLISVQQLIVQNSTPFWDGVWSLGTIPPTIHRLYHPLTTT